MKVLKIIWDDIQRGENIDLYITVIVAIGLAIANVLNFASEELIAPITLAVLGLLAISNLINRHHFGIQLNELKGISTPLLKNRSELPSLYDCGQSASEIVIIGMTLIGVINPYLDFFEQKMRDGCKLRFLLLDPESPATEIFGKISKIPIKSDIRQALRILEHLMKMEQETKGKCEVRLSDVFLSYGLAAFDPDKEIGFLNLETYTYKTAVGERPFIELKRNRNREWFKFYQSQYEQLWLDSNIWEPMQS